MKLFLLTDGDLKVHIFGLDIDDVKHSGYIDQFFKDLLDDGKYPEIEEISDDTIIKVSFEDNIKISHTAKEWCTIYSDVSKILCSNEI